LEAGGLEAGGQAEDWRLVGLLAGWLEAGVWRLEGWNLEATELEAGLE
jgi:hypothetical protein